MTGDTRSALGGGGGRGHYPGRVHSESRPTLVVVGPPGAGKTTVGRVLARRLAVGFADVDAMIEERTGKSIADMFLQDGEDGFRALERQVVAEALASHDGVLALGGGAVLAAETRALLRRHRVVHLSVGLADGLRRTGMSTARPLLAGVNPRATFKALLDARAPLYREVATVAGRHRPPQCQPGRPRGAGGARGGSRRRRRRSRSTRTTRSTGPPARGRPTAGPHRPPDGDRRRRARCADTDTRRPRAPSAPMVRPREHSARRGPSVG